jgi:outer membrane protein assembly factor BamB
MINDDDLIRLVQESSPSDFSAEQLSALRDRWPQSAELRQALFERLAIDSSLHAVLNTVQLNVDELLERRPSARQKPTNSPWWMWIGLMLLVGLVGVVASVAIRSRSAAVDPIAQSEPGTQTSSPEQNPPLGLAAKDQSSPTTSSQVIGADGPEATGGTGRDDGAASLRATQPSMVANSTVTPASPADGGSTDGSLADKSTGDQNGHGNVDGAVPSLAVEQTTLAVPADPWWEWLQPNSQPWADNDPIWTTSLAASQLHQLTESEWRDWWASLPGEPLAIQTDQFGPVRTLRFSGLARLKAPWLSDSALRLVPFDIEDLHCTFWQGDTGILVRHYRHCDPHAWAAFRVRRQAGQSTPTLVALLDTDHGALARHQAAVIDFRQRGDTLELACGGTAVISVPLKGTVDEVVLSGSFRIRGSRWVRWSSPDTRPPELKVEQGRVVLAKSNASSADAMPTTPAPSPPTPTLHTTVPAANAETASTILPESSPDDSSRSLTAAVPIVPLGPGLIPNGLPGELDWIVPADSAVMVQQNGDGSVTITSTSQQQPSFVYWKLPTAGVWQVLTQVAAATPGTAVYLGDAEGRPRQLLRFLLDRRSQQMTVVPATPTDNQVDSDFNPEAFPPPFWAPETAYRLVAGAGQLQVWTSATGRHWGQLGIGPVTNVPGAVESVGLICLPSETPRTMTVQQLQVRALDGLQQLADAEALGQWPVADPAQPTAPLPIDRWWSDMLLKQPAGLSTDRWLATAAIAALQRGPDPELAHALLLRLESTLDRWELTDEQRFAFLDDVASLIDTNTERNGHHWQTHFAILPPAARQTGQAERQAAYLHTAWQRSLQNPGRVRRPQTAAFLAPWMSTIAALAAQPAPVALQSAAKRAEFWLTLARPDHHRPHPAEQLWQLSRWAQGLLAEDLGTDSSEQADVLPLAWRHPWQLQVDKEGYNARAELNAALASNDFADACRVMQTLGPETGRGLLPATDEPTRAVSLPVALKIAFERQPRFRETLESEFAAVAALRIRQAVTSQDPRALEACTWQYFGTSAAAEAHRHLGDRWLSIGQWDAAERQYRAALQTCTATARSDLLARQWLIKAFSGQPIDLTQLAGLQFEGRELTQLLANRAAATDASSPSVSAATWPHSEPVANLADRCPPGRYRWTERGIFDGQAGHNPGRGEYREADPYSRQLAGAVDGQELFISNRIQLSCVDTSTGQPRWAYALGSEFGEAHAHRFTPMRPLVLVDRVIARLISKAAVELVSVSRNNGELQWRTRVADNATVFSDPIRLNGQLLVLAGHPLDNEQIELRWTALAPDSGAVLWERPLTSIRDAWATECPVQVAVTGDVLVVVAAGLTLCSDLRGEVQWLSKDTWIPTALDPLAYNYVMLAPVVDSQAVVSAQPNHRAVYCRRTDTGQLLWRSTISELQGLAGANASTVFVRALGQVIALDRATGAERWSIGLPGESVAMAVGSEHLLIVEPLPPHGNQRPARMTWLSSNEGLPLGVSVLELPSKDVEWLGPMFAAGPAGSDGLWCLLGTDWKSARRVICQLQREPGPVIGRDWSDPILADWIEEPSTQRRHRQHRQELRALFGSWEWLGDRHQKWTRTDESPPDGRPEWRTQVRGDRPQGWATTVIPRTDRHWSIELGHLPGESWDVIVTSGGRECLRERLSDATSVAGWRVLSATLPPTDIPDEAVVVRIVPDDKATVTVRWRGFGVPDRVAELPKSP